MVKKLSLKEFYENHGNAKPLSSCLPTKPGDVPRDADQGYDNGHRLADLALDSHSSGSSKPHYRNETFYVGGGAHHGAPCSNGHHYGSSSDVHVGRGSGDIDYYGSSASYHQGRPYAGGPPPPGRYGRAPYPVPPPPASGPVPVGSAPHPAAGSAGPGAAPMGNGSGFGNPTYGAYAAPPPPHAPAGAGRGPSGGGAPYPAHVPPPADEDVWYPPPPPPPPRPGNSSPSNQVPASAMPVHGGNSSSTACSSAGMASATDASMGIDTKRSAAAGADRAMGMPPPPAPRQQHVPPQPAAATAKPANEGVAKGMVPAAGAHVPRGNVVDGKPAGTGERQETPTPAVQIEKPAATPFASGSPPALAGPKNEFAERLAARAMSHATRAKSSLLAGGGSTSSSLTTALSGAGSDSLGGEDSVEQGSGAYVKPAHPFGRPRLVLKPRTAPLPDSRATTPSQHGGNTSSASSDSGMDAGEHSSSASVASSNGRPRLQLQPRSLPPSDETAGSHGTASSTSDGRPRLNLLPRGSSSTAAGSDSAPRKASVFGEAKPKDLPDPALMEGPARTTSGAPSRLSEAAVARLGSGSASHGGRWDGGNSVASGDREDDWQTAGRGRKGSKFTDDRSSSAQLDDDPFFGSNSRSSYVPVPAPRAFDRDIMRDGRAYGRQSGSYGDDAYSGSYGRKYGSPNGHGWGGRGSYAAADADHDEGVFRRALPTRQLPLAI